MKKYFVYASMITLALCFTGCKKEAAPVETEVEEMIVETGVIEADVDDIVIEEDNDEVMLVEEEEPAEEAFEDGIVVEEEGEE